MSEYSVDVREGTRADCDEAPRVDLSANLNLPLPAGLTAGTWWRKNSVGRDEKNWTRPEGIV